MTGNGERSESSAAKRRREEEDSSSTKLTNSNVSLDNLGADLLLNILVRLPTAKSVVSSKLVSKGWCSLIEKPYFASKFISHHINNKLSNNYSSYAAAYHIHNPPFLFISRFEYPGLWFFTIGTNQEESPNRFTLEFLPQKKNVSVSVMACCDDLLFCIAKNKSHHFIHYYICNPFTRQWGLLPLPPIRTTIRRNYFGFVCGPNYQRQGQQYKSRFRVVCFTEVEKHRLFVDLYCSETGQWDESLLLGPEYEIFFSNVVSHEGKLHWYNGTDVVAYDPFNDGQTIFIDGSEFRLPNNPYQQVSHAFGVCQGLLRFMQIFTNPYGPPASDRLSVWELKDYETGRFSLVRVIYFNTMISKEIWVRDFVRCWIRFLTMAFDPENKDVVYLGCCYHFISCNIQSGELEIISKIPYEQQFFALENVRSIKLPWWPTPVSMCTGPRNAHLQQ